MKCKTLMGGGWRLKKTLGRYYWTLLYIISNYDGSIKSSKFCFLFLFLYWMGHMQWTVHLNFRYCKLQCLCHGWYSSTVIHEVYSQLKAVKEEHNFRPVELCLYSTQTRLNCLTGESANQKHRHYYTERTYKTRHRQHDI